MSHPTFICKRKSSLARRMEAWLGSMTLRARAAAARACVLECTRGADAAPEPCYPRASTWSTQPGRQHPRNWGSQGHAAGRRATWAWSSIAAASREAATDASSPHGRLSSRPRRVAQRAEQLSSKSRWAAIVRRREGATAVFRRRCRLWPATRKLFAGGVTADRDVTAGSGVATRSGLPRGLRRCLPLESVGGAIARRARTGRCREKRALPHFQQHKANARRSPQSYFTRAWEREKLGSIEHRPRVEPPAPPQATRRDSARLTTPPFARIPGNDN